MSTGWSLWRSSVTVHRGRAVGLARVGAGSTRHRVVAAESSRRSRAGLTSRHDPRRWPAASCNRRVCASFNPDPSATTTQGDSLRSATSIAHNLDAASGGSMKIERLSKPGHAASASGYGQHERPIQSTGLFVVPCDGAASRRAASSTMPIGGCQDRGSRQDASLTANHSCTAPCRSGCPSHSRAFGSLARSAANPIGAGRSRLSSWSRTRSRILDGPA